MKADGSRQRQLTDNDYADFAPVFSPDGTRIAYDGGDGVDNIRVMRTNGSRSHRLTLDPAVDEYADWGVRP